LKIKLKNEASLKNVGNNNTWSKKASDKKNAKIIRSSTKEEYAGHHTLKGNLSVPRTNLMITPSYIKPTADENSNQK
jgi:hypothetical protein